MKGNIGVARKLRRTATDVEHLLWSRLRDRSLSGLKFRRQAPMAGFIVDFVCAEARLIVEIDGGQHADRTEQDAARTRVLEACGYHVVRFWNGDVLADLDSVLETILSVCRPGEPT